ncbi:unnamed protein product [Amaranthus hypochondriacus]
MVVPLKPGKFYGSSLPRPRFYTNVMYSDERVDPPTPVLDPLMSWAGEAHWSMGGLSFNRLRLQGKIEGNVNKLKKERETSLKKKLKNSPPVNKLNKKSGYRADSPPPAPISKKRRKRTKMADIDEDEEELLDEEIEIEKINQEVKKNNELKKRRRLVRKLGDDFELVADSTQRSPLKDLSNGEPSIGVALRTRSRTSIVRLDEDEGVDNGGKKSNSKGKKNGAENGKAEKTKEKNTSVSPNGSRISPRLKQKSV